MKYKLPNFYSLLFYGAFSFAVVFVSDLLMKYGIEVMVGRDEMIRELVVQLKWCLNCHIGGYALLSEDQAQDIYNHWTADQSFRTYYDHWMSDNLTLTVFMALASEVRGLASLLVVFWIFGITGLVVLIKDSLPKPWVKAEPQSLDLSDHILEHLDHQEEIEKEKKEKKIKSKSPSY